MLPDRPGPEGNFWKGFLIAIIVGVLLWIGLFLLVKAVT